MSSSWFFFNDTATTEIYTLSLHDALPISSPLLGVPVRGRAQHFAAWRLSSIARAQPSFEVASGLRITAPSGGRDRKSTRLNSSHANISYAVFCLKKKTCFVLLLRSAADSS